MKSEFSVSLLSVACIVALAPPQAQQREGCDLEVLSRLGSTGTRTTLAEGGLRYDIGGGVEATCGNKWMRADSVSSYQTRGVTYLFGNVQYRDDERLVNAERATYYQIEDWVRAEDDVEVTDRSGRSRLTAPALDYYPLNANRETERIVAHYRPHLTFYADSTGGTGQPFEVDADRMHIYGDSLIAGEGDVVATRGDLVAHSDSMDLNLARGELWLLGEAPQVEANATLLQGDSILVLLPGNQVREIQSWPDASATGEALELRAPMLRLLIEDNEIARAVASAGDSARTGAVRTENGEPWAHSVSQDYALTADSIDILRPGGRLERVIAVGRARANTLTTFFPDDSLLSNDWLVGDTITGHFAAADSSPEPNGEPELERLVASGSAKALYHIVDEAGQAGTAERPAVNYVIGRIVTLALVGGEVHSAEVVGPSTGVYLEPLPPGQTRDTTASPPDTSVVADTVRLTRPGGGGG
ncbi:MAG: hypothetical protein PVI01_16850 [Gemmatimonadales bacterium]|jgi:lipopolysaccharide export system protein LptA